MKTQSSFISYNTDSKNRIMKTLTLLTWLLCLTYAFYFLSYKNTKNLQSQLQKKENHLILQFKKNQKEIKKIQREQEILQTLKKTFQQLTQAHTPIKTLNQLFGIISETAQKNGLAIQQLKPLDSNSTKTAKQYTVTITALGQYQNFLAFLEQLTQKNYFIALKNLEIKKTPSNKLSFKITLQTLFTLDY